ncbi:MAG: DUF4212 domain-containing protein [Desulfuromonadia bacterium]
MASKGYRVNPFKPKEGYMVDELAVMVAVLIGWFGMNVGFQILLAFLAETDRGGGILTRFSFFNLPFHYWFTGQFLPLWFVILCVIYNLSIDRLTDRHSRRKDDWQ